MNVISFSCTECFRPYRVAETMAGRRVKCKDCGTALQVPGGTGESTAPPDPFGDVYGLSDAAPSRPGRRGMNEDGEYEATPNRPRRSYSAASKSSRSRRPEGQDDPVNKLCYGGTGAMVVGVVLGVMARHGWVLSGRRGRGQLDPETQMMLGTAIAVIGGLMTVAALIWALVNYLKHRETPQVGVGGGAVWVLGGLLGCLFLGGSLHRLLGRDGFAAPAAQVVPAAAPAVPAAFAPPNIPPPPPNFGPPPGDAQVTLSNGRVMSRTSPLGHPLSGVEIEVDYQLTGAAGIGEQYQLVIKSGRGLGALSTFVLQPSGTLSGESPLGSLSDGPFEAWMEVEQIAGRNNRKVSNSITLQVDQAPPPRNPFEGMPGPQGPPGFPNAPPGFPNAPPGFPGAGPGGMPGSAGPPGGFPGRPGRFP